MSVSREIVIEGIITFALEAKATLRDAAFLYQSRRFANSVILSTLTLEHLGQSFWLIALADNEADRAAFTPKGLVSKLRSIDHVKKLGLGLVSVTTQSNYDGVQPFSLDRESAEFQAALTAQADAIRKRHKEAPGKLHLLRTKVQYPELNSSRTGWKSSSEISEEDAYDSLTQAGNNYGMSQMFYLKKVDGLKAMTRNLGREELFDETFEWSFQKLSSTN